MTTQKIKAEHDEGMESRILAEARELFLERGFAMTSTVEIARRVGCNQALVHYYFRSKELLFTRIFEEQVREFAVAFFDIDRQGGTFFERLKRKIEAHFDVLERERRLPFLILSEVMTKPERLQSVRDAVRKVLEADAISSIERDLQRAIGDGVIRPIEFCDFVMNIVSLNVSSFLSLPVLEDLAGFDAGQCEAFIKHRRQEVVTTIINSLRPLGCH